MKITYDDHDRITIVTVSGDLTHEQTDVFRRGVSERLERGVHDFVLLLPELTFIDSAGLESLLWLQDVAAENLGQVRIVAPTADICKILEMTRLEGHFERHSEVTEAIRSLK